MPDRYFRAPGRVNLIGDHTDYNEGYALPVAIDLECRVSAKRNDDRIVRVNSENVDPTSVVQVSAKGDAAPATVQPAWGRYVAGVVQALATRGRAPVGINAVVSSTVPVGSGLSSSAALEIALALALSDAGGLELPPLELALACREAEQVATGVPCGIMDQLASIFGVHDCALLIDCQSLEIEPIPLPHGIVVIVADSGTSRSLGEVPYAERRRSCEKAASRLGLRSLREAELTQVEHDPRARHVVAENTRVLEFARCLRQGDVAPLGALLSESHASLRDDFEVSTQTLDTLVDAFVEAGALGARLTGAGFGGSIVALAEHQSASRVAAAAAALYQERTGIACRTHLCTAADGAGLAN